MKYSKVFIEAIGYELPPVVVTSEELEDRLASVFEALKVPRGQLAAWTGIHERRWWEEGYPVSHGAIAAGRHALQNCGVPADALEALIYGGVCREQFEPATACAVASGLGVGPDAAVYDVSNACLGVLNGMVEIANRIELGQIRAGMVTTCETAREIIDFTIQDMLDQRQDMTLFRESLATLTGGSGAAAVVLTDGSFGSERRHQLLGGTTRTAPGFHNLCRWGIEAIAPRARQFRHFLTTDSYGILKNGVELGARTWGAFLRALGWADEQVDRIVCHQVGQSHRDQILAALGLSSDKDFPTYPFLGNTGTAALPLTAALADEQGFLRPGDRVGMLGIGSGLNCLMLGVQW